MDRLSQSHRTVLATLRVTGPLQMLTIAPSWADHLQPVMLKQGYIDAKTVTTDPYGEPCVVELSLTDDGMRFVDRCVFTESSVAMRERGWSAEFKRPPKTNTEVTEDMRTALVRMIRGSEVIVVAHMLYPDATREFIKRGWAQVCNPEAGPVGGDPGFGYRRVGLTEAGRVVAEGACVARALEKHHVAE